eukprot:2668969-Rhodomonas_salina.1
MSTPRGSTDPLGIFRFLAIEREAVCCQCSSYLEFCLGSHCTPSGMVGSAVVDSASRKQQGPRSSIQVLLSFVAQSPSALPPGGCWEVVLKAPTKQPLHLP